MHSPAADTNPLGSQAPPRLASRQLAGNQLRWGWMLAARTRLLLPRHFRGPRALNL